MAKQRCAKCWITNNNIQPARHPLLFPDQATATAVLVAEPPAATRSDAATMLVEPPTDTVPIVRLILADEDAVRRRLFELVKAADEDVDLAKYE